MHIRGVLETSESCVVWDTKRSVRQPGRAFSRHQLMEAAIPDGSIVLERTIDVHIKTLRKKLTTAGGTGELIETVRGVGYRFREAKAETH